MDKYPSFPVVDMHLHLPITQDDWLKPYRDRYVANYGIEKWNKLKEMDANEPSWLPLFGFPTPEETSSDYIQVADRWYKEAKDNNLSRVFFLTGGGNEILSEVVNRHPDVFSGFAHHQITDADAAEKLEKAIKTQNLCGFKILAPTVEKPLSSKEFEPVFEVANNFHLPVNIHFGILGGAGGVSGGANISPMAIAEVVKRFPDIKFIIPHFGCGYTNELLQIMWGSPNVYVDTSGNNLWTRYTMERYSLERLFHVFTDCFSSKRVIFGTDSEWFPRGFAKKYLELQYDACENIGLKQEQIQDIFQGNAERLISEIKR